MSFLLKLAAFALCAYVAILLAAYFGQRRLMYLPDRTRTPPAEIGLADVLERTLVTTDGAKIILWYGKPRPGNPTLLYFHGNAGSLAMRGERMRRFMNEGWGVAMMSYRGFSGSTGSPSEAANLADALLAYESLISEGVDSKALILYGESLGTGIAARIATERPAAGLILEAPYTSVVEIAVRAYPFLPVRGLLWDRYETRTYIADVRIPLLILHGERDGVIPVAMGRELIKLANEPKRLVVLPNAGHNDVYIDGNPGLDAVRSWIGELKRPKLN